MAARPLFSLLLLVGNCGRIVRGMSASSWLASGQQRGGDHRLGLLPFGLEDALQPGETREITVFDESLRACLVAAANNEDCVGGLLFDDSGAHYDLAPLLQVEEVKVDVVCTWARLRCVGRVAVNKVMRHKKKRYRVAHVSLYTDREGDNDAPIPLLRSVHDKVALQRRQLREELIGSESKFSEPAQSEYIYVATDNGSPPYGIFVTSTDDDGYDTDDETEHIFVGQPWERELGACFFHCRDLGELDDEENGATLQELVARRQAVLAPSDGPEGASSSLRASVGDVWNVASDEQCALQLLSFAAAATLGPLERAQALIMKDTTERLNYALETLSEQQQLLTEVLVARGVASE